jgi:hypothetical protein
MTSTNNALNRPSRDSANVSGRYLAEKRYNRGQLPMGDHKQLTYRYFLIGDVNPVSVTYGSKHPSKP